MLNPFKIQTSLLQRGVAIHLILGGPEKIVVEVKDGILDPAGQDKALALGKLLGVLNKPEREVVSFYK